MMLADAKNLLLMGNVFSWDSNGKKPLSLVPDDQLMAASKWFAQKIKEEGPNPRMREQIEAIRVVLEDRESRNPQAKLAL